MINRLYISCFVLLYVHFAASGKSKAGGCSGDDDPHVVDTEGNGDCGDLTSLLRPDLYEGDILLPDGEEGKEEDRNAILSDRQKWPKSSDGLVYVPYDDSGADSKGKSAIESAARAYEKNTCIRIIKRSNENDYIRFIKDSGCYSLIGKTGGGQQLSLGEGCQHHAIAVHEIMHAIGFKHEQSRPDRDQHLKIFWENIRNDRRNQFDKASESQFRNILTYDHGSVMQYAATAFSSNGQKTMESIPPGKRLGNDVGFTDLDIQKVNELYACGGVTGGPVTTNGPGPTNPPQPTPPPRTLPPRTIGPPTGSCQDQIGASACRQKLQQFGSGMCQSWRRQYCKQTCGACTGGPGPGPGPIGGCQDQSPNCVQSIRFNSRLCFTNLRSRCLKTCGLC